MDGTWALTDFGFCVTRESGVWRPSSKQRMTPETCAPELLHLSGLHDGRLDVWGVGCIAFRLATGIHPFTQFQHHLQLLQYFQTLDQSHVPSLASDAKLLVDSE